MAADLHSADEVTDVVKECLSCFQKYEAEITIEIEDNHEN